MRFFILLVLGTALVAGGCKKKEKPVAKKEEPAPAPAPVDPRNSNYVQGGGAVQNIRQAAKRVVNQHDMAQLGIFILDFELTNGKLPTASEIKAMLTGDAAGIRKQIDEGVIILTGTTNKSGLWAYEVDADKAGGIVLTGPSANARRATADEVKQLLANN
jgi:hypothetical protein